MKRVEKNKSFHFRTKLILGLLLLAAFIDGCHTSTAHQSTTQPGRLKFVTYNIHHCNPPADSATGKIDVDAVAAVLQQINADVIALQEVDVNTRRGGGIDQAKILAEKLGMYVVFGKAIDYDGGDYGLAFLSKYPLVNAQVHRLPSNADTTAEPRILLTAEITVAGTRKLLIGNTHLDVKSAGNRELQATKITGVATAQSLPFVLMGDWNDVPESRTVSILDQVFERTCVSCPVTCPEDGEKAAIDFIAFSRNAPMKVLRHLVIPSSVSDHYPVVTELTFTFPNKKQ
jgi:endonuclease/exonuclease/phosphatase family metal-dependent hydrolase